MRRQKAQKEAFALFVCSKPEGKKEGGFGFRIRGYTAGVSIDIIKQIKAAVSGRLLYEFIILKDKQEEQ